MSAFVYEHVVGFEETSLVGNVYFANYLLWQGRCREQFLHEHVPEVAASLMRQELALFTRRCVCDYCGDEGFAALEDVRIEMRLEHFRGGRMTLGFDYLAPGRDGARVARGTQDIACKVQVGGAWVAAPFPPPLIRALLDYAETPALREALQDALDFQARDAG